MHKILTLLLFLCFTSGLAQNITLKGKVTDNEDFPLESATIYLSSVKDSSVIDYTISGKNGLWELKTRKVESPVFLKISFIGLSNYKEQFEKIDKDKDFGTTKLADAATELSEVVIESEIPPIRIKKDTLEFNASSFKVRPDANVEALLKQLPGVEIDSEGKIKVNGKEVNQILVNGKPFFDADGQIAIKNLPAEIIDKVQVSDTKTKKEELSGRRASGDNSSINLTLKKDRNKGIFGKFTAGYGSDGRYELSSFVNYFKDKMKISAMASSNNINATGFSMNEAFGSMSGGRNFSFNGSGARGITRSTLAGLNYADEWFKDFDASANYSYKESNTENNNKTSSTDYLPESEDADNPGTFIDKSYRTESESRSENERFSHDFNTDFRYKIDSTSTVHFAPKISRSNTTNSNTSRSFSLRLEDERLMNENEASSYSETESKSFSNQISYYKASRTRKGRGLSVSASNSNSNTDNNSLNQSNTVKYKYPGGTTTTETEIRDQIIRNDNSSDSYSFDVDYSEPITDSLSIAVIGGYDMSRSVEHRDTYDYDELTGQYSTYNDSLSSYSLSKRHNINPRVSIRVDKSKYNFSMTLGTNIAKFYNYGNFVGEDYVFDKDYLMPSASMNFSYRADKGKSLYINYNYGVSYPQASQVLSIQDKINPLNTFIGNPNLRPGGSHSIMGSFRNFNTSTRSGIMLWMNVTFFQDQITRFSIINDSGETTTTYRNISGAMNASISPSWFKTFKQDEHSFRLSTTLSTNFGIDKGYLNGRLYDSQSIRLGPSINLGYDYGELLTINPSYNYSYNQYNYTNYRVSSTSNFVHRFNIQATSYWPKHFVFANDFGYTYNSNITGNFKKDFYLWNTSIGYNFLKDDMTFQVKVYDLLNQNVGTSRTVGPTSVTDQENTVLRRYVMFSLTYKLGEFGGMKRGGNQGERPGMRMNNGMRGRRN